MKFLFDLFPVILFFLVFKLGEGHQEAAHALVAQYLGGLISGGHVTPAQSPILLATAVGILATALQIAYLLVRGRKVDGMLWLSLGVIAVMGGATIYFHDETFIKWKPTILYWAFALALSVAQFGFRNNLMRKVMEANIQLPDAVWDRVGYAWMAFLAAMGLLNLFVAFVLFKADTSAWVSFKLFGFTAIFFVFIFVQMLFLSKHIKEDA
ncbi:septation protein A [Massilia solisilvae]|uniref:Inner membrane-spanning protein YciB n=1 Tax=Massilia solisilvae TaxID=1811225 RepID=A0ABT2BJ59_9BURK|nr:septation protein A [Massilia solisilvae]MCS0608130.1 septation protein A [Massilia solisilvae]